MAKKEVVKVVKLQVEAGKANPAPPVGPALGQAGINIMEFCKAFNDKTKEQQGPVPTTINVFKDKSFEFFTKISPTSYLIKQELKMKKGSTAPGLTIVKKMTKDQVKNVAEKKLADFNTNDVEQAMKIVAGQAASMGIEVEGYGE
jgi:large subunit ribosomal protein L11